MKDFLGRELAIGDNAIITVADRNPYRIGTIITITEKMVRIKWGDNKSQNKYEYPHNVIKIDEKDTTWYYLNKK